MAQRFLIAILLLWICHWQWKYNAVFSFTHSRRFGSSFQRTLLRRMAAPSEELDAMRRWLEQSWNQSTMGRIPTTPELAVLECVESLRLAQNHASSSNIYFIELRLPQYDRSSGSKIYDELLMAEFAMQLIQRLQWRAMLAVRDRPLLNTITRVLNARMGRNVTADRGDDALLAEKKKKEDTIVASVVDEDRPQIVEYDDFAPLEENASTVEERPPVEIVITNDDEDVANFRASLLQNWNKSSTIVEDLDGIRDEELLWEDDEEDDDEPFDTKNEEEQYYRWTSLLGDCKISQGADMVRDVVAAVRDNALPREEETALVFLSPHTQEELLAVRALAGQYGSSRNQTLLFLNCQLDPLPQELLRGTTVYSILPLRARPTAATGTTSNTATPQIVVLRRYPQDWQVHVDLQNGRGLQRLPTSFAGRLRGPSMAWIQSVVVRYLQSQPPSTTP